MCFLLELGVCNENGKQDNEEEGIDCGGGGCPDCSKQTSIIFTMIVWNIYVI